MPSLWTSAATATSTSNAAAATLPQRYRRSGATPPTAAPAAREPKRWLVEPTARPSAPARRPTSKLPTRRGRPRARCRLAAEIRGGVGGCSSRGRRGRARRSVDVEAERRARRVVDQHAPAPTAAAQASTGSNATERQRHWLGALKGGGGGHRPSAAAQPRRAGRRWRRRRRAAARARRAAAGLRASCRWSATAQRHLRRLWMMLPR